MNLGDPRRSGIGIPDVLIALGLSPPLQPVVQPSSGFFANLVFDGVLPRGMFAAADPFSRYYGSVPSSGPAFVPPAFAPPIGFASGPLRYQYQVPVGTW